MVTCGAGSVPSHIHIDVRVSILPALCDLVSLLTDHVDDLEAVGEPLGPGCGRKRVGFGLQVELRNKANECGDRIGCGSLYILRIPLPGTTKFYFKLYVV